MRHGWIPLALILVLASVSIASAQRYVYGRFCATCLDSSSLNRLYDDGLHHDGAAGDGVWGADIVSDVPPGGYSWIITGPPGEYGDASPMCWCSPPPANAYLWTSTGGEVIHFREAGPAPGAVACDHGIPPGAQLEVVYMPKPPVGGGGSYPTPGVLMIRTSGAWSCVLAIPDPGAYFFRVQSTDNTVFFSPIYNAHCGFSCSFDEVPKWGFATTLPNTNVLIQFDDRTGVQQITLLAPTATRTRSWGELKVIYR